MSKGSSPRPFSVSQKQFDSNWDRIFKKPSPKEIEDDLLEKEEFERIGKLNKSEEKDKDR